MPKRFLKPGITTSDKWNRASYAAQSLYVRLVTLADDYGRYDADPRLLKGSAFALRDDQTPESIRALCVELEGCELAIFYISRGKPYLQLTGWYDRPLRGRPARPQPDENCEPLYLPRENWLANLRQWLASGEPTCANGSQSVANGFPPTPTPTSTPAPNAERQVPDAEGNDDEETPEGKEKGRRKAPLPDDAWLEHLKTLPAYQGIDVAREFSKAQAWCETNGVTLSRKRFVNWLNRADKPLARGIAGPAAPARPAGAWALQQQLQALDEQIAAIRRRGREDAMGNLLLGDADRAELKALKEKRAAVVAQLAKLT